MIGRKPLRLKFTVVVNTDCTCIRVRGSRRIINYVFVYNQRKRVAILSTKTSAFFVRFIFTIFIVDRLVKNGLLY